MKKRFQRRMTAVLLISTFLMGTRSIEAEETDNQLISEGFVARLLQVKEGDLNAYITLMRMNGKPAYCIEPKIPVEFHAGVGPTYSSIDWQDVSTDVKQQVKRYAYYGYEHPSIGNDPQAYVATQLLIWKTVDPEQYESVYSDYSLCPIITQAGLACGVGKGEVETWMEKIETLSNPTSLVPSFAGQSAYELSIDQPLTLTDTNHHLQEFEAQPTERVPGITFSSTEDELVITADEAAYQQNDREPITVTFLHKGEQVANYTNGMLIYQSGDYQKIYTDDGIEPPMDYSIQLTLPTTEVVIQKEDEYGLPVEGVGFRVSLKETMQDCITTEDGKDAIYLSDATGKVLLPNLPCHTNVYVQEVCAPAYVQIDSTIHALSTKDSEHPLEVSFTNPRKQVTIEVIKRDAENPELKLNEAGFDLYELLEQAEEGAQTFVSMKTKTALELQPLFTDATSFALTEENPHLNIENKFLKRDGNAYGVLQVTTPNGTLDTPILISSEVPEGLVYGFPVFHGMSGHQYLSWTDSSNSSRVLSNPSTTLYLDSACQNPVAKIERNELGIGDLNELEPGTYYQIDPQTKLSQPILVESSSKRQGILQIPHVKAGSKYLLCESQLPEGYDYGEEACTLIIADGSREKIEVERTNTLRRLKVNVVKVDQEDESIPLNQAWFTATDLSVADAIAVEPVRTFDIPAQAKAGDTFLVRNANVNGIRHRYKITAVNSQGVEITQYDGGVLGETYAIPAVGVNRDAPMLYQDVLRASNPPKMGTVFEILEKEPIEQMKEYRICSLIRTSGTDIFHQPTKNATILRAVLSEDGGTPFTIHADGTTTANATLGVYVTGGLLFQKTEEMRTVPISFAEVLQQNPNPQEGDVFNVDVSQTTQMPSFEVLQKQNLQEPFLYDGALWKVESSGDPMVVSCKGQSLQIGSATVLGSLSYIEHAQVQILSVETDETGIHALTIGSNQGNSWYLTEDNGNEWEAQGQAGQLVEVFTDAERSHRIAMGYTNANGQVLFESLPEGSYTVQAGDQVEYRTVRNGALEMNGIPYGHTIQICEIKSPLGYLIGEACQVIVPKESYTEDTVENHRTNARTKTVTREVLKQRKMGDTQ